MKANEIILEKYKKLQQQINDTSDEDEEEMKELLKKKEKLKENLNTLKNIIEKKISKKEEQQQDDIFKYSESWEITPEEEERQDQGQSCELLCPDGYQYRLPKSQKKNKEYFCGCCGRITGEGVELRGRKEGDEVRWICKRPVFSNKTHHYLCQACLNQTQQEKKEENEEQVKAEAKKQQQQNKNPFLMAANKTMTNK